MATGNKRNYSILVGVELDTSDVQRQLDALTQKAINIKLNVDGKDNLKDVVDNLNGIDKAATKQKKSAKKLQDQIKDLGLTYQQANEIMMACVDVISKMTDQVFELDDALTDFRKVSELSGSALDDYVDKLSQMGLEVGRTGKP